MNTEIITRTEATATAAGAFDAGMMEKFVSFIDRGEKTTRTYLTNLRQFRAWMLYAGVTAPSRADVIAYREYLTAEHDAIQLTGDGRAWEYRTDAKGNRCRTTCKPNTVKLYLRSVCQLFAWTEASGLYPNIAANIHAPKVDQTAHKKEALKPAELLAVEKSISRTAEAKTEAAKAAAKDAAGREQRSTEQGKRMYAMYLLAVNAGLRTVEISRANVKDFVTRDGQAWLYVWGKGKAEPDQKKPLAAEVAAAIREYLDARTDRPTAQSPLFVATGNRSGGKRLDVTTISKMLKKALRDAGFDSERITAHSLRHSTGTAVMEITGDIYQTQKYMRHASPATTEIYLHNDTTEKEAATAQALYNAIHGTKTAEATSQAAQISPEQLAQLAAWIAAQQAAAQA